MSLARLCSLSYIGVRYGVDPVRLTGDGDVTLVTGDIWVDISDCCPHDMAALGGVNFCPQPVFNITTICHEGNILDPVLQHISACLRKHRWQCEHE